MDESLVVWLLEDWLVEDWLVEDWLVGFEEDCVLVPVPCVVVDWVPVYIVLVPLVDDML